MVRAKRGVAQRWRWNAKKRIPVRFSEKSVNMQIRYPVFLQGSRGQVISNALIDTGAEVSVMPTGAAQEIGAWLTNYNQALTGITETPGHSPWSWRT